ncbi:MAG: hypothetical protein NTZ94_01800 [Verrucomicrobia bacterium]|nr:hypothetical protein [Verrucomicrobiota bacterium]
MPSSRHTRTAFAWRLALLAATLPVVYRQVTVSDAWWHAALGKWMLEMRSLPDLSRFYFSPVESRTLVSELRWEWLGDILLYLVYAIGGAAGIQCLVVACLVAGLAFLSKFSDASRGSWTLLLLASVCLGTYQLQLARNSVYSLAFYPALLWLGTRKLSVPNWREYACLLALLAVWSCMHGSCALGWVTACALYGPRALSGFRKQPQVAIASKKVDAATEDSSRKSIIQWHAGLHSIGLYAAAMLICLLVISAGRRDAMHFLGLPFRHLASTASEQVASTPPAQKTSPKDAPTHANKPPTKPQSLKEWLNSSIWKRDPAVPWSNDYWSPIDMIPGMRPIEIAYALAALAAVAMLIFRNVPAGLLLAWLGAVFLGLGYVRMFGYTALSSGAVILVAMRHLPRKPALQAAGWLLLTAWIGVGWWMAAKGKIDSFIPDGQHVSRSGQVPIYDEAVADWVKREFPDIPVFTTIETGSYCVLRWNFEKQVFLDGFFAPHPPAVWNAYHAAMRQSDLRPLEEKFGIRLAILPTTSPKWVDLFLKAKNWAPIALGNGTLVFAHRSVNLTGKSPALLASAPALQQTTHYYREAALRSLFKIIAASAADKGFRADEWASQPTFEPLRKMAAWVFPKL